jgi:hypothetical protein
MPSWGGIWGGRGGPLQKSPEQRYNHSALEQEKVNEVVGKEDARYDAMTPDQRDEYYMKPSFKTRLKKALHGGQ